MKEVNIQGIVNKVNNLDTVQKRADKAGGKGFDNILVDYLKEVNKLQLKSDEAVKKLATGNEESIHETMIAIEKASISFQMMMQIRNKIIEAYDEIKQRSM